MSHRLQVIIPDDLDRKVRKAAQRLGVSRGEWVRRALQEALSRGQQSGLDPVARLASLEAPTGDIGQMLAEIESGRT